MERFCRDLKEHATRLTKFEKKKNMPLIDKEYKSYKKQNLCYICKKEFSTDGDNKRHHKVRDHCHYAIKLRGAAHNICNLRWKTPKEISVVFHDGSTHNYHFIINQLAKEFNGKLKCLGQN